MQEQNLEDYDEIRRDNIYRNETKCDRASLRPDPKVAQPPA